MTLIFNFQSHDPNPMLLARYFIEWIGSFASTLCICEIAGILSTEFDKISTVTQRFKWYLFTMKMRRMLPLILANAQRPVTIKCFGSHPCNRETFGKVCEKSNHSEENGENNHQILDFIKNIYFFSFIHFR